MFCPGANYEVPVRDLVEGDEAVVLFQLELPMDVVGAKRDSLFFLGRA
jgi:ribokinase